MCLPHGDSVSSPLCLPWPSLGSPLPHSGSVSTRRHSVSFPLTTLLVNRLSSGSLRPLRRSGSGREVRFKPRVSVCGAPTGPGPRTPGLCGPRGSLLPPTSLWRKQPQRDLATPPRPSLGPQRSRDRPLAPRRPSPLLVTLRHFPATCSPNSSLFTTQQGTLRTIRKCLLGSGQAAGRPVCSFARSWLPWRNSGLCLPSPRCRTRRRRRGNADGCFSDPRAGGLNHQMVLLCVQ